MFERQEISRAVDLQKRSYRLLRWVASAVDSRRVSFDHAHGALQMEEAARAWCTRNYDSLPSDARPERADVEQFANLFASYLGTSFELVEEPGSRLKSHCGCWCSYCTMMVAASHLKAKKVSERDKRSAALEKTRYLEEVVRESGLPLEEAPIRALTESKELREDVALATYRAWLLKRMRGQSCGPEVPRAVASIRMEYGRRSQEGVRAVGRGDPGRRAARRRGDPAACRARMRGAARTRD